MVKDVCVPKPQQLYFFSPPGAQGELTNNVYYSLTLKYSKLLTSGKTRDIGSR